MSNTMPDTTTTTTACPPWCQTSSHPAQDDQWHEVILTPRGEADELTEVELFEDNVTGERALWVYHEGNRVLRLPATARALLDIASVLQSAAGRLVELGGVVR